MLAQRRLARARALGWKLSANLAEDAINDILDGALEGRDELELERETNRPEGDA